MSAMDCLHCLHPTEQALVTAYCIDRYTQSEIGEQIGVSGQHAGRMIRNALRKLKRIYEAVN